MASSNAMKFIPMRSIKKDGGRHDVYCSGWVATEKIHGSSYQFSSSDGINVGMGARRRDLNDQETYVLCDIKKLFTQYNQFTLNAWHIIKNGDRWAEYRASNSKIKNYEDEDSEVFSVEKGECHVRIYGELYGGGGIEKPIKDAVQKEIIYSDDHRFYVFGITVNFRWMTVTQMNDVCKEAGFPYYGVPVCEPRESLREIKRWLVESNFLRSVSAFTDKPTGDKAHLEGVVMSPLTRPSGDYDFHAVKFLGPKFLDVKEEGYGKTKIANFCTKQRYHSVISKLDIWERKETQLVVNMFVEDIIKETPNNKPSKKLKGVYVRHLLGWLAEDDYYQESYTKMKKQVDKKRDDKEVEAVGVNEDVDNDTNAAVAENDNGEDQQRFSPEIVADFVEKFDKMIQANTPKTVNVRKRETRKQKALTKKEQKALKKETKKKSRKSESGSEDEAFLEGIGSLMS